MLISELPENTTFKDFKSVCLFRLSAIGDILNLIPVLDLVFKFYPKLKITWVIGKGEYSLFKHLVDVYPNLNLVVFDKNTKWLKAISQMRHLADDQEQGTFDLLIHAQTSMRANVLAYFIKAKHKLGFSKERSFEGHSLVTDWHLDSQQSMHVMYDYFDLFKPFLTSNQIAEFEKLVPDTSLIYSGSYPKPLLKQQDIKPLIDFNLGKVGSLQALKQIRKENRYAYIKLLDKDDYDLNFLLKRIPEDDYDIRADIEKYLSRKQPESSPQKIILVNPSSSAEKKNWTMDGYIKLIVHLLSKGHYVVVTAGPNSRELNFVKGIIAYIRDSLNQSHPHLNKHLIDLAGKTNLVELVLFTQLATLVVSPDSGPMHLASCLGIPTVGLFAYINPLRSGPIQGIGDVISVFHQNLYGKEMELKDLVNNPEQFKLDLANWRKKPSAELDLMTQISPDEVIAKVDKVLARY